MRIDVWMNAVNIDGMLWLEGRGLALGHGWDFGVLCWVATIWTRVLGHSYFFVLGH